MKITLSKIVFLALVSISLVSCSSEEAQSPIMPSASQVNKEYTYSADETQVMALVNNYRQSMGLPTLAKIDYISFKSEEHNEYMIATGTVNHNFFADRSTNLMQVLGAKNVSENLAYSYSTPESAVNAWLNSDGHRANIEGNFTHFGVSIRTNAEGKKYYTNIFVKK